MIYDPNEKRHYKQRQWEFIVLWAKIIATLSIFSALAILILIGGGLL